MGRAQMGRTDGRTDKAATISPPKFFGEHKKSLPLIFLV